VRRLLTAFVVVLAALAAAMTMASARDVVPLRGGYPAGSIVVLTNQRTLLFVLGNGQAIRYPVGVGRAGMAWHGTASIDTMLIRPDWSPPRDIRRAEPNLPRVIPGGTAANPMGEAVLGLNRGNYAIHGTNSPGSVGHFVSHGCIRMYNRDILDLYRRVGIGTRVYVLP
jgi:lipoprotein-anchoring transpeptidase ErfK/SrfK